MPLLKRQSKSDTLSLTMTNNYEKKNAYHFINNKYIAITNQLFTTSKIGSNSITIVYTR